jgi:hypothetical protein
MKASATLSACALAAMATGCANNWKARSQAQATIYPEVIEIPVLWADSTFVGEVDGTATERGKGYVLVDPGHRVLTVFHVSCPLPVIAVFCLLSSSRQTINRTVRAGAAYRIGPEDLVEVRKDGEPVGMTPDK